MKASHFVIALAALALSCNYEPDGVVFTEVSKPSVTGISVDLNMPVNSPYQLVQPTTFTYSINTGGKQLIRSDVFLNGTKVTTSSSPSVTFTVNPADLPTGTHALHIEVVFASGSGSLADVVGAEVIVVLMDRSLVVDHVIPGGSGPGSPGNDEPFVLKSVKNVNNTIEVSWSKYSKFNFQNYKIKRTDFNDAGVIVGGAELGPFNDANQTSVEDHSYLFGKSTYTITLTAANQEYSPPSIDFNHKYRPRLFTNLKVNGDGTVKWTSMKELSGNLGYYEIRIVNTSGGSDPPITFTKYTATDTSVSFSIPGIKFGSYRTIRLWLYSKSPLLSPRMIEQTAFVGNSFPVFFEKLGFDITTKTYYGNVLSKDVVRFMKIGTNGERLDSINKSYESFAVSQGSPFAIANDINNKPFRIDLKDMTETALTNFPDLNVYKVSGDGKILARDIAMGTTVFSQDGVVLTRFPSPDATSSISADGLHVANFMSFYKFDGTTFERHMARHTFENSTLSFIQEAPARVVIGYINRLEVYDLDAKTSEQTLTYTGPCSIDPVSKKIGCLTGGKFVVLNPGDLSIYKQVNAQAGTYHFFNESIICNGAILKLSDIP